MKYNELHLHLKKLYNALNLSMTKADKLANIIEQLTFTTQLRIDDIASKLRISPDKAEKILDELVNIHILKKITGMYRCSQCDALIGTLSKENEGITIPCFACNHVNYNADIKDTENIYYLYEASIFLFRAILHFSPFIIAKNVSAASSILSFTNT